MHLRMLATVFALILSISSSSSSLATGDLPAPAAQAAGRDYFLIRFQGPIEESWKAQVSAQGAELLAYFPDFEFKARMTQPQAAAVEALIGVDSVQPFPSALKLSRSLRTAGTGIYTVRVERGGSVNGTANAIRQLGGVVNASGDLLTVAIDAARVRAIAAIADVATIQNYQIRVKHNDVGAGQIMGAGTANTAGYDGSTQTVAVADTGIGDGTASGAHPDIPGSRVKNIYNWPGVTDSCFSSITNDGAKDVDSGHGTHVSGSVLSDGGATGDGKGTAPAAGLVFQAVENWAKTSGLCKAFGYPDGYYLVGLPADLRDLLGQAYSAGARVHANSWGSDAAGDYTADSANTDSFVWSNRDMTITFSAGNAGADANDDGIVDNDSIGSPATAKNVITVGASENERRDGNGALYYPCDRNLTYGSHDAYQQDPDGTGATCAEMNGNNRIGTGSRWGFTAEPIASDPTANSQEQMAAFSSRGPTDDGRIKPDVVAPGTWILSGYSGLYQEGYGDPLNPQNSLYQWDGWGIGLNSAYKWMGGTSMSNPLAAGGAAVVRDFYQKVHARSASAALVKATLINSAVDLLDENNDGANDNRNPIPNVHEGWGRVNVAYATDGSHAFNDDNSGVATNGARTFTTNVTGGAALKVSVAWTDYPSTESASKNLVNDLDLKLTSPSGLVFLGNVFDKTAGTGGWSLTGGSADRINNVENVYVRSAEAGTWTIEVRGYNVPNGPQPFALVVDNAGALSESAPPPPPPPPTAATMHVGDLDAKAATQGNGWNSTLTVKIEDSAHAAVSSATVSVTVSGNGGYSSSGSCTTGSAGTCSLKTGKVNSKNTTLTWTVTGLSHGSLTYASSANHDPETDSDGTGITVSKP